MKNEKLYQNNKGIILNKFNNNVAKLPRCLRPIRHCPLTAPLEIEYKVNRETF